MTKAHKPVEPPKIKDAYPQTKYEKSISGIETIKYFSKKFPSKPGVYQMESEKGEILFTFVGDEENLGSNGLAHLRQSGLVKPDLLICGAQTQLQAIFEERGVMWIEVLTKGMSAHAGEPEMGDNAINRMVRIINKLYSSLLPILRERRRGNLQSTLNIGIIEGGTNTNAVPDRCRMEIDRRLLPEENIDDALAEIKSIVAEAGEPTGSWQVSLKTGTRGFSSSSKSDFIKTFQDSIYEITGDGVRDVVAIGASDARYFVEDDIVLMTFGPGHAKDGHKTNEFVPLEELKMAALIQKSVIKRILGFFDASTPATREKPRTMMLKYLPMVAIVLGSEGFLPCSERCFQFLQLVRSFLCQIYGFA